MTTQQLDAPPSAAAPAPPLLAALDIGGTKIAAGLVEADGTLVSQVQRPTPAGEGSGAVIKAVYEAIDELAADPHWGRVRGLGIGSAGPIDLAHGTVSPVNIPGWREYPLVRSVGAHPALAALSGLPIVLGGDAVAMTAAEHWCGAARGHDNALCLVVSTGVGAGLVLNGAVRPGPSGNAGHLGHISVDLDGPPCACGSRGCLEGFASGTAIARRALDNGWRPGGTGAAGVSAAAVAASARAGDPIALASFDRAAQALAAGIAAVAALVDIEVAIVGGGVAKAGEVLFDPLARHLKAYSVLSYTLGVTAVPALLGTDAGLIGAAALVAPVALRGAAAR